MSQAVTVSRPQARAQAAGQAGRSGGEQPSPGYVWVYDDTGAAVYDENNNRVEVPEEFANS